MTITQQKVMNGLLAEEDQVNRQVANAISQLQSQTDLMLQISAFLFTDVNAATPIIDQEHIDSVTAKFQSQLVPLLTDILPKLQAIEACGNAQNGAANLASMITTYALDPATFPDRYK